MKAPVGMPPEATRRLSHECKGIHQRKQTSLAPARIGINTRYAKRGWSGRVPRKNGIVGAPMGHRPPIAYTRKGEPLLNKEFTVDVLVIGWGKAGKTIAGRLAAEGRKVALVERSAQMYGGQLHQHRVRAYQGPHRLGIQAGRPRPRLLTSPQPSPTETPSSPH